jgi:hypothetical protein
VSTGHIQAWLPWLILASASCTVWFLVPAVAYLRGGFLILAVVCVLPIAFAVLVKSSSGVAWNFPSVEAALEMLAPSCEWLAESAACARFGVNWTLHQRYIFVLAIALPGLVVFTIPFIVNLFEQCHAEFDLAWRGRVGELLIVTAIICATSASALLIGLSAVGFVLNIMSGQSGSGWCAVMILGCVFVLLVFAWLCSFCRCKNCECCGGVVGVGSLLAVILLAIIAVVLSRLPVASAGARNSPKEMFDFRIPNCGGAMLVNCTSAECGKCWRAEDLFYDERGLSQALLVVLIITGVIGITFGIFMCSDINLFASSG